MSRACLANCSSPLKTMQLITIEGKDIENLRMSIFKIKRIYASKQSILKEKVRVQREVLEMQRATNPNLKSLPQLQKKLKEYILNYQKEKQNKSTYRLTSFRLSRYSTVKLDYHPTKITFAEPFFLLNYGRVAEDKN